MMTRLTRFGCALVAGFGLGASAVTAAEQAAVAQSYKSLVGEGFEVKAVTLIPTDQSKSVFNAEGDANVLITLQHADKTAVCVINASNWTLVLPSSLNNAERCSVY